MSIRTFAGVLILATALAFSPVPAYAYLDPGTGSFLFQAVAGAVIGAGFLLRTYWSRMLEGLKRIFGPRRGV